MTVYRLHLNKNDLAIARTNTQLLLYQLQVGQTLLASVPRVAVTPDLNIVIVLFYRKKPDRNINSSRLQYDSIFHG